MKQPLAGRNWEQLDPFLPPRSGWRMAIIGVTSFLGSLSESAVLVLVTLTADSLIREEQVVTIASIDLARADAVLVALAFVAVRIVMTLLASVSMARFAGGVLERAQTTLLEAYLSSSHRARSARPPGDLAAVTLNHGRFTGDLANSFSLVATGVCGLLAFGGTSLAVNPLATVGIAVIGGVLLLCMRPLRSRSRAAADSFSSGSRSIGHEIAQVEDLHREIEVFRVGDRVLDRVSSELHDGAVRFTRLRFLGSAVPQLFQAAMLAAAVLSLLLIVNSSESTDLAAVGAVVLLLVRSMSAAQQLVNANQRVIEFGSYASSLNELIGSLRADSRTFGDARPLSLAPVALHHVWFTYDGETQVLDDVSVTFDRGELVGIVGPSGAGKSTLVELLLRLRRETSGSITCGGTAMEDIDPAEFARRVAFVPQQAALIAGTVAENVDLFRGLPEERIRTALEQAHLADEIDGLPDGIHTALGADERALSGGQRQRLTIARALAGEPEILVLDEPTSALDAISENSIRQMLAELPEGRVVIVVAHRYSTLRSCNRILVVRDGRIEIDASPDEVARRSDFFRTMVSEGA